MHSRTRLGRYRWRQVQFSSFALSDSISTVPRASGSIFMFCVPEPVFGGTEGAGSSFHVLHSRTHFRRYRGRLVLFSCFTLPDSFWAVPRAPGSVFIFCAPGLVLSDIERVSSLFHVLRSHTHFRRYRGCRVPFSCFALPYSFSMVPRESGPILTFCAP
jgi:hypothetical protein